MSNDPATERRPGAPPQRQALEVVPDTASLAARAAEWCVTQIGHALAERDRAVVALSGGGTPKAVFALLAQPSWRGRVDWSRVHVFWGDERFVPPGDAASNVKMTHEALLDHVDIPAAHVYAIPADDGPQDGDVDAAFARAQDAAASYATTLHAFYGGDRLVDERPFFDVVLMGLGDDGHTASLFPGNPVLDVRDRWTSAVKSDNPTAPIRITMTYPLLESTHAMLWLVGGAGKRDAVARVFGGDQSLPATRVHARGGVLWLLDEAAADPAQRAQH